MHFQICNVLNVLSSASLGIDLSTAMGGQAGRYPSAGVRCAGAVSECGTARFGVLEGVLHPRPRSVRCSVRGCVRVPGW